jgi:hypothetical protein
MISGTHRMISGTHRMISGTHRMIFGTHRMISGTHRMIFGTHRMISGTHRMIFGTHRQIFGTRRMILGTRLKISGLDSRFRDSTQDFGTRRKISRVRWHSSSRRELEMGTLSSAHGPSPVRQLVFSQRRYEMDDPRSGNAQLPESLSPLAGRGATNRRWARCDDRETHVGPRGASLLGEGQQPPRWAPRKDLKMRRPAPCCPSPRRRGEGGQRPDEGRCLATASALSWRMPPLMRERHLVVGALATGR